MNAQQLWMWLVLTGLMSVAAMVIGASISNQVLAILAGAMFAIVASAAGWRFTTLVSAAKAQPATDPVSISDRASNVSARFAKLIAAAWAWGGAAMLGSYYLTDLSWQHAWQYGAGMLLIAALVIIYAGARVLPGSWARRDNMITAARWMTRLQGVIALAGVVVLAFSGKLQADKPDWAANVVFVAGGLTIYALSMAALRAEQRALSHPLHTPPA